MVPRVWGGRHPAGERLFSVLPETTKHEVGVGCCRSCPLLHRSKQNLNAHSFSSL